MRYPLLHVLNKIKTNNVLLNEFGFTLVELMVTIAVMAIIISIAAPSLSTQLATQRNKTTAYELYNGLTQTKIDAAIARKDQSYTIADANRQGNSTVTPTTLTTLTFTKESRVSSITADQSFKICDRSNSNGKGYKVTVTPIARITISGGETC